MVLQKPIYLLQVAVVAACVAEVHIIYNGNEHGVNITVNVDIYRTMTIVFFFAHALLSITVNDVWFQQDGTSYVTIDLLRQTFDGRLIRRNSDVN